MKYWIETIWKKHEQFFSPNSVKTTKGKKTMNEANVSSPFLVEIAKLRQVTNITHSNRDKSLINFLDINVHISNSNWTEWNTIQEVIIERVISKSRVSDLKLRA